MERSLCRAGVSQPPGSFWTSLPVPVGLLSLNPTWPPASCAYENCGVSLWASSGPDPRGEPSGHKPPPRPHRGAGRGLLDVWENSSRGPRGRIPEGSFEPSPLSLPGWCLPWSSWELGCLSGVSGPSSDRPEVAEPRFCLGPAPAYWSPAGGRLPQRGCGVFTGTRESSRLLNRAATLSSSGIQGMSAVFTEGPEGNLPASPLGGGGRVTLPSQPPRPKPGSHRL